MTLETIFGQPSWRIENDLITAYLTQLGGHLGPITFKLEGQVINPYHVAYWAEEDTSNLVIPDMLRVLRGDFFCAPFGSNDHPYQGEQHPAHGESSNLPWTLDEISHQDSHTTLKAHLNTSVRAGKIDKEITLVAGHHAVYQRHTLSGMAGPMNPGHHAMLRFPDRVGSGLLSFSPYKRIYTPPEPLEVPTNPGYSFFSYNQAFESLEAVPSLTKETLDASRYPARRGYEDLAMIVGDPDQPFGWTAVAFPTEGFVWIGLKNPRILRQTLLWFSNGGRHYSPWNSRHVNVMGIEEFTSYFHYGLAESVAENPISAGGVPTYLTLDPNQPLSIPYIMLVAAIPDTFTYVASVDPGSIEDELVITDRNGQSVSTLVELSFLTV